MTPDLKSLCDSQNLIVIVIPALFPHSETVADAGGMTLDMEFSHKTVNIIKF